MICVKDVRGYARRLPRLPPGAGMNRFILARRSAYPAGGRSRFNDPLMLLDVPEGVKPPAAGGCELVT